MSNNKVTTYLLYAIGEIILVVIGILIAVSIDDWKESKKQNKKELALLNNLKNNIWEDVNWLQTQDSLYAIGEKGSAEVIKLFSKAKSVDDLKKLLDLDVGIAGTTTDLQITNNTYTEAINSSSLFKLRNETLKKEIINYYLQSEVDKKYVADNNYRLNDFSYQSAEYAPMKFLMQELVQPRIDLNLIDTSWIGNPNSSTYLATNNLLQDFYNWNNVYRRKVYQRCIKRAKKLLNTIDKELESRSD